MSKSKVTPNAASPVNGVPGSADAGDQPQVETPQSSSVNWEAMRLPQNFADHIQTRRIAVSVPVRRPDKQSWVYLHPDPAWRRIIGLIDDKVNRRTFAVH